MHSQICTHVPAIIVAVSDFVVCLLIVSDNLDSSYGSQPDLGLCFMQPRSHGSIVMAIIVGKVHIA